MKKFLNLVIPLVLVAAFVGVAVVGIVNAYNMQKIPFFDVDAPLGGFYQDDFDWQADYDDDGLSNEEEYNTYKTDFYSADTDSDGLYDSYEILHLKTDPLLSDTDKDGLMDGAEIELGLDPLKADSLGDGKTDGHRQLSYEYSDEQTDVSVKINGSGNISDVAIAKVEEFDSLSGVVSMYNIHTKGEVANAKITLPYELEQINSLGYSEDNLKIYYFDPIQMQFEKQSTTIDKQAKTLTANVPHFSHYAVCDESSVQEEVKIDLFFILDNSGSMFTPSQAVEFTTTEGAKEEDFAGFDGNDAQFKRVSLSTGLIDKMDGRENLRFGAGKFTFTYSNLSELTSDADSVKEQINTIKTEKEDFNGTYIGEALYQAVNNSFDDSSNAKFAILLTDGQDSTGNYGYSSKRLQAAIDMAVSKKVKVIVIGLGSDLNFSALSSIAFQTNGTFYNASDVNLLEDIYEQVSLDVNFGLVDTDDDGEFDSIRTLDTGFIPKVDGFSFNNFNSVQSNGGHCHGMAVFALLNYTNTLPQSLQEATISGKSIAAMLHGAFYAQGYDFSESDLFSGNKNLYDFKLDEKLINFHNEFKDLIDMDNPDGLHYSIKEEYLDTFKTLGYRMDIYQSADGRMFDWPMIDLYSDALEENIDSDSLTVLKAIMRLYITQFVNKRVWFSMNPDKAFEMLTSDLAKNIPTLMVVGGNHTINAIGLLRDLKNPDKFIIEAYDNNYSGEVQYIYASRKKQSFISWIVTGFEINKYEYSFNYKDNKTSVDICGHENLDSSEQ